MLVVPEDPLRSMLVFSQSDLILLANSPIPERQRRGMFIEAVAQYLTKLRRSGILHMSLLRSFGAPPANSYKHHAPTELRYESLIS
jgi:hypothetical protein